MRFVQLQQGKSRRVALVEEPKLRLLKDNLRSVYVLAQVALKQGKSLGALIQEQLSTDTLDYDSVYSGKSDWKLLLPIDHPDDSARCMVSGTGLTHLGSAKDRNTMHAAASGTPQAAPQPPPTDSMKMFQLGVEGGRPEAGKIGVAPEWFFKGSGAILRAHGEPLFVPPYAEDGGEEAEVAGIYIIAADGQPRRIGLAMGNEFSDHRFEKKNYLNLAGSKIRNCALGPELVIDADFKTVPGEVAIERAGKVVWSKAIATGEAEMCHSLQNIEHHHFKFETHRRAGDVHVHYFGAHSLSFGAGVHLVDGDLMRIRFDGFGRALCNPVKVAQEADHLVSTRAI